MPPTNQQDATLIEQLQSVARSLSADGRPIAASCIHDAIARIQSQPQGEGWVKFSERKPTEQDGNARGYVLVLDDSGFMWSALVRFEDRWEHGTHWRRMPAPPPAEPTPEELEKQAVEEAVKVGMDAWNGSWEVSVTEAIRTAVKAGRASARRATT